MLDPLLERARRPGRGVPGDKGSEFDDVLKSGRTHLQDATPIRLGQEFTAYGHTVQRNRDRIEPAPPTTCGSSDIGGTAVGTGLNAEPAYPGADGQAPASHDPGSSCARARIAFS